MDVELLLMERNDSVKPAMKPQNGSVINVKVYSSHARKFAAKARRLAWIEENLEGSGISEVSDILENVED